MLEKISRLYSNKLFIITIIATMILEPVGMIMELSLDDLIPFEIIAYGVIVLLLIGLFITRQKKDYILMNGIVSGILIYEFVRYAYLLSLFTGENALSYFRSEGFYGCFALAFLFLSIATVFLITYNHFTINRNRAVNRTKIILNQFLLFLFFFVPIVFVVMNTMLEYSSYEIITYAVVYFGDAFLLLVVACCELELAMNRMNEATLDEPVTSDVKLTLWYAVSFLFGLFCLSITILLSNAKTFMFVLSIIDVLFSLGLLVYYLNKKKQAAYKPRICLHVGLITTIGLMVVFIGYYIWTIIY